jgi:hypothetical protein
MICSVKQPDGSYRYYEVPRAPMPTASPQLGTVGLGIEQALPALPFGARAVGRGHRARGILCRGTFRGPGLGTAPAAAAIGLPPLYAGFWALVEVAGGLWLLSRYFLR